MLPVFSQQSANYAAGEVLFKVSAPFNGIQVENGIVSTEASWFNDLSHQYQIRELHPVFNTTQEKFRPYYRAIFDSIYTVEEVVNAFAAEGEVEYLEPNYIYQAMAVPNDPYFDNQWGLRKIKADSAWQIESGNSNAVVVVVDSGTDLLDNGGDPHEDLWDNLWNGNSQFGYNATNPGQLPDDDHGHGTHVAGITGAVTNNDTGIAGTAGGGFGGDDGIQIMTVKGLRRDGNGLSSELADGIRWAAEVGADIMNMSWGGGYSATVDSALQEAYSNGTLLIAAAGNAAEEPPIYPARLPYIIAVAATDSNDTKSSFSNFGTEIEVCAPGGGAQGERNEPDNIFSTTPMEPDFYVKRPSL